MVDNVVRCQQLVLDFRRENFAKAWKEDVLQLYNVMWWVTSAYLGCFELIIVTGIRG